MTVRRLLWGLALMVGLFVTGSIIGGVWDDSDTAGAITVTLWSVSVVGAAILLVLLGARLLRQRA